MRKKNGIGRAGGGIATSKVPQGFFDLAGLLRRYGWCEYGHFHEGYFPKIGKLQRPLIPDREMVGRRYADIKIGASGLEAMLAPHVRCAGYLRKRVEAEVRRQGPAPLQSDSLAPKPGYLQRILDSAFGAQGDKIILDDHIGTPDAEKFNKEAEFRDYYSRQQVQLQNMRHDTRQRRRLR